MALDFISNPQSITTFVAPCDQPLAMGTKAQFETLLDEYETQRYRAYRFAEHAELYLTAHALLRTTLSRHADVRPEAWRFTYGGHGRPEIVTEQNRPGLRFNLSHTKGLVVCAVAHQFAIGVDVEPSDRRTQALPIAQRFFSRSEFQRLAELPHDQQTARFIELWTLKEAFIKACGGGLSIPLGRFSMMCNESETWRVSFETDEFGTADEWQFASLRPSPRHRLAVAVHRPNRHDLAIHLREIAPDSFFAAEYELG